MCFLYCIIIAVIAAAACAIHEQSWGEFFDGLLIFGLCAAIVGILLFGFVGSTIACDAAESIVIESNVCEIVSLNEVFGDSYSENDYILYRDNRLTVYVKDENGVVNPQKLIGKVKICFSDFATKAFVAIELEDFKNGFLRHFFWNPNEEYYVVEVPTGSTIIPYGDMFVKEAA